MLSLLKTNESEFPLLVSLSRDHKGIVRSVTPENFLTSVHKLTTKTAENIVFRAEIPDDNEQRAVKVLNTDTIIPFSENNTVDVMIAFTSPRCGYCQALEPILNEFSSILIKNNVTLNIGNYNVNENEEQPNFEASGVPTLFFKKAGTTNFVKLPSSVRTISEFLKYVSQEGGSSKINLDDYSELLKNQSALPFEDESEVESAKEEAEEKQKEDRDVL